MRIGFILLLAAGCSVAQEAPTAAVVAPPFVRASGEAVVTVRPDQAVLNAGVTTQAPTAEAASAQNAKTTTAVMTELKAAVGNAGEVRTIGYSLHPNYRYSRDGGTPSITGYTANNTVEVRLNDLTRIGQVIDAATRSGSNNVGGIQYALRNEQAARSEALANASRSARASAEAMATALGARIVRVRSLESGFVATPRPMMQMAAMRDAVAAAPPTPVEPGTIEVRASVTATFDIAQ